MISVFDFKDYREFLRAWLEEQPGRGASSRLAETMNISPSMMSLVMKGEKNFTSEQAIELVEYLALNELESDYFFVLLEIGKSGSYKFTQRLNKKRDQLLAQARKITNRVKKDMELTEEQKSVYYSSWLYTGVRNLAACPTTQDVHKISEHLNIPMERLQPIVDFLVENNLCNLEKGQLSFGPQHTHNSVDSPYVNQQHRNWRLKGNEMMELRREQDLFYTCPMSLSEEAFEEVRKLLPTVIQQVLKIVGPSPSEKVACFSLDFFKY
ncbi:TIGR02147 family protein [Bdellovibrio sp. SKB1291214]|uniref:TIGR02147 family protein n=1 Tax=Bdellovibrio sp. SKB1291214 TaxID=1732569 RepID=UPI001595A91E|nr:TIGR02147 family protein [Bdellovibrio sp. SKB1291214]UYL10210.1 TIGR02147 family protein [Bdellovibrio sp. SKB1291214]